MRCPICVIRRVAEKVTVLTFIVDILKSLNKFAWLPLTRNHGNPPWHDMCVVDSPAMQASVPYVL